MTARKIKTAILISGRGSNMVALVEAARLETYPAEIVGVISNKPNAAGLEKAQALNIPTAVIDHTDYSDRETFEQDLHEKLLAPIHCSFLICDRGQAVVLSFFCYCIRDGHRNNRH